MSRPTNGDLAPEDGTLASIEGFQLFGSTWNEHVSGLKSKFKVEFEKDLRDPTTSRSDIAMHIGMMRLLDNALSDVDNPDTIEARRWVMSLQHATLLHMELHGAGIPTDPINTAGLVELVGANAIVKSAASVEETYGTGVMGNDYSNMLEWTKSNSNGSAEKEKEIIHAILVDELRNPGSRTDREKEDIAYLAAMENGIPGVSPGWCVLQQLIEKNQTRHSNGTPTVNAEKGAAEKDLAKGGEM